MLPPEATVLIARQCFLDAQDGLSGATTPLGYVSTSWYGTSLSDDRGCFAVVDPAGALASYVGDVLQVGLGARSVFVYVIGSQAELLTDLAVTRRAYMALSLLAVEPISARIGVVTV